MIRRFLVLLVALVVFTTLCAGTGLALLAASIPSLREGWQERASQPGELTYIALGDSAAQGLGASSTDTSYVGRVASQLAAATGKKVRTINLSKSGATVGDVLGQQIPQLEKLSADRSPDLVTLDIGSNDVVHRTQGSDQFSNDYEAVLQALPPGKAVIADVPYFGGRIRADARVRQANDVINRLAPQYDIPVARLYDTLRPRQSPWIYAADLFHPNDRGYRLWHQAFSPHVDAISRAIGAAGQNGGSPARQLLPYVTY